MSEARNLPTGKVVEELKANGEDFEWYPTTDEIINKVAEDILKVYMTSSDYSLSRRWDYGLKILDIGAGDGRVLLSLQKTLSSGREGWIVKHTLYGIEKSQFHYREYGKKGISILGTEFLGGDTLIDKEVDVVFCNPPYSQYEIWAEKIILEAGAQVGYLVIPQRWENSDVLRRAIERRGIGVSVLGEYDFEDGDRKARAKVHLLRLEISVLVEREDGEERTVWEKKDDPFDFWFDETFPRSEEDKKGFLEDEKEEQGRIQDEKGEIVSGPDMILRLVNAYNREMGDLIDAYKKISTIPAKLLRELGVEQESIKEGLRKKISGLKNKYWAALFEHYEPLSSRLTSRTQERFLGELRSGKGQMDFTASNAYAVTIWAIEKVGEVIDAQLVEFYKGLFDPDSVLRYKSTQSTYSEQKWRYRSYQDGDKFYLDYRIVKDGGTYFGIADPDDYHSWNNIGGLHRDGFDFISDFFVIADTLGFSVRDAAKLRNLSWESGKPQFFYLKRDHLSNPLKKGTKTNSGKIEDVYVNKELGVTQYLIDGQWFAAFFIKAKEDVFAEIRAYKKGTIHLKVNQKVVRALNFRAGKLLGWLNSPRDAEEEMGVVVSQEEEKFFKDLRLLDEKALGLGLLPETV